MPHQCISFELSPTGKSSKPQVDNKSTSSTASNFKLLYYLLFPSAIVLYLTVSFLPHSFISQDRPSTAMANPSRFIQIFNTNPLINYEANDTWTSTPATDSIFQIGNFGLPMAPSLQTVSQNGTFSFSFNGTYIAIYGSYLPDNVNPQSTLDVQCTVDSTALTPILSQSPQNNWHLCKSGDLPAGSHTLTFTIDVHSQSAPFFFDYLLFAPSLDSQISNALVRIDASDPSIILSGNWTTESDTHSAPLTTSEGASLNISFIGQQLTFYGVYSTFLPFISSQAEYSIDGDPPTKFLLSGIHPGPSPAASFNQVLFQTRTLQLGLHGLTVRYLGNELQTGLGIGFVVIETSSAIELPQPITSALQTPSTTSKFSTPPPLFSSESFLISRTTLVSSTPGPSSSSLSSSASRELSSARGPNPTTSHSQFTSKGSHQSRNALIGIIVSAVVLPTIVALIAFYLYKRRKSLFLKRKISPYLQSSETPPSTISIVESPLLHREMTLRTATSDSLDGRYGDPSTRSSHSEMIQSDFTGDLLNRKKLLPQVCRLPTTTSSDTLQVRSLPTLLEPSIFEDDESVINMKRVSNAANFITTSNDAHLEPVPSLVRPLPKPPAMKGNLGANV